MNRERFKDEVAEPLVRKAGVESPAVSGPSRRFACFADDLTYTMVAARSEKQDCDLGLAYGLKEAGDRKLRLILPERYAGATLQRSAWLKPARRPEVMVYTRYDGEPEAMDIPSRTDVVASYDRFKSGLPEEFRKATLPLHLRDRADWVAALVTWIAGQHEVDPAHRQGQRAWHSRGQKVLEIRNHKDRLVVVAGIQSPGYHERIELAGPMSPTQVETFKAAVVRGVRSRLDEAGTFHRADEHWMQGAVRRSPRLVGLEMTSLREVPAWRRRGALSTTAKSSWGRGFIDLLGVDAAGTIQVVETKLVNKNDAMVVFQALDYLVFCEAYREPVTRRLDVVRDAPMAMRIVIGAESASSLRINRFVPAQLEALDDGVEWSVQTLTNWFHAPSEPEAVMGGPLAPDEIARLSV